jgi:hypothetical protein
MAGMTEKVNSIAESMPPIPGAAKRCIMAGLTRSKVPVRTTFGKSQIG